MPNWNQILDQLHESGSAQDIIRRGYLKDLQAATGRNIIIYYSGWLQKPDIKGSEINDADKNGLMTVIHQLDRSLGLDLVLHTPGGDIAATESIVDYLRSMFGTNIRAIIPQLALSGGTLIACACKEIVMGTHSSLGPIDPQFGGIPAHGIVEEFNKAANEIRANQLNALIWGPILQKYHPTLIGECNKAMQWAETLARDWLATGMFAGVTGAQATINNIIKELIDHALNLSHARHISASKAAAIGLKITNLETDPNLQDLVLSVHHATILTLSSTPAFKIIENHSGTAFIQAFQQVMIKPS